MLWKLILPHIKICLLWQLDTPAFLTRYCSTLSASSLATPTGLTHHDQLFRDYKKMQHSDVVLNNLFYSEVVEKWTLAILILVLKPTTHGISYPSSIFRTSSIPLKTLSLSSRILKLISWPSLCSATLFCRSSYLTSQTSFQLSYIRFSTFMKLVKNFRNPKSSVWLDLLGAKKMGKHPKLDLPTNSSPLVCKKHIKQYQNIKVQKILPAFYINFLFPLEYYMGSLGVLFRTLVNKWLRGKSNGNKGRNCT